MNTACMLGCDWGTTSLRLRLIALTTPPAMMAEFRGADGIASVAATSPPDAREDRFKQTLRQAIQSLQNHTDVPLDKLPIVISGMASSSIGWQSLPYANLPFDLSGNDVVCANLRLDDHAVLLISGVRAERDVMRGEETELIGLMQLPEAQPARKKCVAILPGTHSKHVDIVDGKIIRFRTLMTGEMYSVISKHSVLRHSICVGDEPAVLAPDAAEPAQSAFVQGVHEALNNDLLAALFQTRTRQLLENQPAAKNAAFLSGVLIGSEIGALRCRGTTDDAIVLCAGSAMSLWYLAALETAGLGSRVVTIAPEKVDQLSIHGQAALLGRLRAIAAAGSS